VRLDTFVEYHRDKSWTWERLALTRARVLFGPQTLCGAVEDTIRAALTRPQDPAGILRDARAMREKLAAQFPARGIWDTKFAPGGLVDIEFVAQALQLVRAPADPSVLDQNSIAALEKLEAAGALAAADAETLIGAARLQQGLTQVLRIALDGPFAPEHTTRGLESLLMRDAKAADFSALVRSLTEAQTRAHAIFQRLIAHG
jgi:glutamate-ammonia-ligase adenylyltransferase